MDCNKSDCIHYKVCEEWKSLGNDNYINESNGNCDLYSAIPYNPTGDLISREALKETIIDPLNVNDAAKNDWYEGYYTAKNEDVEIIDNAPAVEDRPQGIWVDSPDGLPKCCCSLCGAKNVTIWRSFCPNCGAKIQDG